MPETQAIAGATLFIAFFSTSYRVPLGMVLSYVIVTTQMAGDWSQWAFYTGIFLMLQFVDAFMEIGRG